MIRQQTPNKAPRIISTVFVPKCEKIQLTIIRWRRGDYKLAYSLSCEAGSLHAPSLRRLTVLGLGQTYAMFCCNIVQHCSYLLRLVAVFFDRLVKRTQQLNATRYAADHTCYNNDYYVLSIKSAIFNLIDESTRSNIRMPKSNHVVFKWSNDRNIGSRNKMLRLRCVKI